MEKILVDTNIIIEYLRLRNKKESLFYKIFLTGQKSPVISHVTVAELYAGKSSLDEKESVLILDLLDSVEIIYPNKEEAKKTGKILLELKRKASFQDAEIAACSVINNLPLLTKNKKDFEKIKGVRLFRLIHRLRSGQAT